MIDFIKVYYSDKRDLENLIAQDEAIFPEVRKVVELRSGEIEYPMKTALDSMDVQVSKKSAYVKNSVHKLYDYLQGGKGENYSDFTFSQFTQIKEYLEKSIIDVSRTRITNLEFGINIEVPRCPTKIIENNVIMHKHKTHSSEELFYGKGYMKRFEHNDYQIKIYDKGKQYGLDKNILRFELRFKNSKCLNRLGVFNLNSLVDKNILQNLFNDLMRRFDELFIIDLDNLSQLDQQEMNDFQQFTNPNYWQQVRSNLSYQTQSRRKKAAQHFFEQKGLLRTKSLMKTRLISKFNFLIKN